MTPGDIKDLLREAQRLEANKYHTQRLERLAGFEVLVPKLAAAIEYLVATLADTQQRELELETDVVALTRATASMARSDRPPGGKPP